MWSTGYLTALRFRGIPVRFHWTMPLGALFAGRFEFVPGVWLGFVIFALPGLALAIVKRDRSLLRKPFPYGPFMVIGALIGLVWGPTIAAALWG